MRQIATFSVAAIMLSAAGPAGAAQIGVASTIAPDVSGTLNGNTVSLNVGDGVHENQVIETSSAGSTQLIFVDETAFNIGPGSTITLDEFIYSPNQGTGSVILGVTQGAFRFISGNAPPETYTIRTPTATIGLRGTIFNGFVDGVLTVIELIKGKLYICPAQGSTVEGQGVSGGGNNNRVNEDDCELVEEPGEYYIGQNVGGDDGTGGGGSDPNDGADDLEDPFEEPMDHGCEECEYYPYD
jgi:hypothetical protein